MDGWVSSLLVGERKVERMRPTVIRFSNTETRRAGNMMEEEMDVEEVWIEPVLSDSGAVGEDMLDLISLESINVKNVKNSLNIFIH